MQRDEVDSELLRRPALILSAFFEHSQNVRALHLLQSLSTIGNGLLFEDEILFAQCDLRKVEETRQHWPFVRDRRIDAYGGITQRFLDS